MRLAYITANTLVKESFMQHETTPRLTFIQILEQNHPQATAWIRGGSQAPQISGLVKYYDTPYGGTLVEAEVFGLPNTNMPGSSNYYAMPDDFRTQPAGNSGDKIACGTILPSA